MLLLLLVVGSALLAPGGESGEGESRAGVPSTYSDGPEGLRAFYLTCEALRMPVGRWARSLRLLDPESPAVVAVVEEDSDSDLAPLREWVEGGGRLLLGLVPTDRSRGPLWREGAKIFGLKTVPAPGGEVRFGGALKGAGIPSGLPAPARVFERGEGETLAEV
ncbi:MAG: hypothetical protein L0323_19290, partial [Planctomycetes bacterium]|nr:hypothetical protein [Planctomycetota bacterium]